MRLASHFVAAVAVLLFCGLAAAAPRVVHREAGTFGDILVVDDGPYRYLRFGAVDGDDQSMIDTRDPAAVPMPYVRFAAIGLAYAERRQHALMVGLGGGTFSGLLRRYVTEMKVEVAEIDAAVVSVAKRFFGVKPDASYLIHVTDGAAFIERGSDTYDLILLDAYGGDGIPPHLGTTAFFRAVRQRLTQHGVLVANLSLPPFEERAFTVMLRRVFPRLHCFDTPDGSNRVVIGRRDGAMPTPEALQAAAKRLTAELRLPFDLLPVALRLNPDCD